MPVSTVLVYGSHAGQRTVPVFSKRVVMLLSLVDHVYPQHGHCNSTVRFALGAMVFRVCSSMMYAAISGYLSLRYVLVRGGIIFPGG